MRLPARPLVAAAPLLRLSGALRLPDAAGEGEAVVLPRVQAIGMDARFLALAARVPLLDEQTVFSRRGHLFGSVCAGLIPLLLVLGGGRRR